MEEGPECQGIGGEVFRQESTTDRGNDFAVLFRISFPRVASHHGYGCRVSESDPSQVSKAPGIPWRFKG